MNGRHFILLGVIACAGLLSVHDGQEQVVLCYQIGGLDRDVREIRAQIALCKIQHLALQSPHAVTERATELRLKVAPVNPPAVDVGEPRLPPAETNRSLGSAQGARPASALVRSPTPPRDQRGR